jgi:hypothetical protein
MSRQDGGVEVADRMRQRAHVHRGTLGMEEMKDLVGMRSIGERSQRARDVGERLSV